MFALEEEAFNKTEMRTFLQNIQLASSLPTRGKQNNKQQKIQLKLALRGLACCLLPECPADWGLNSPPGHNVAGICPDAVRAHFESSNRSEKCFLLLIDIFFTKPEHFVGENRKWKMIFGLNFQKARSRQDICLPRCGSADYLIPGLPVSPATNNS